MADVELVIKISEKVYNALTHIEFDANLVTDEMRKSIANGIPLPKGHGRLIDADELKTLSYEVLVDTDNPNRADGLSACNGIVEDDIDIAPTIIEADKAESEDKHTEERTKTHACDCISREAAFDEIIWNSDNGVIDAKVAIEALRNLPSVEPERKKGKWIDLSDMRYKCDQCNEISCCKSNYCCECGADMREVDE